MPDYTDARLDEIDRLVAEKVMGWKAKPWSHGAQWEMWYDADGNQMDWVADWNPTRDRGQALIVFEQCEGMALSNVKHWKGKQPFAAFVDDSIPETITFGMPGLCEAEALTPMLAICLAALKRARVEVPEA